MNFFKRVRESIARQWEGLRGNKAEEKQDAEAARSLLELDPERSQQIREELTALPVPPSLLEPTIGAMDEAIAQWLEFPNRHRNAIAIVGNSVEEIASIVGRSFEKRANGTHLPVRVLQWSERPTDLHALKNRLVAQLGRGLSVSDDLVLIPNLSWCFLRSADGLEGIEYLRRAIARERDCFWVIGCGKLAWSYLNLIAKIAAYLPNPHFLPELNGEQLQAWLSPVVEDWEIQFDEESPQPSDELETLEIRQQKYFETLARVSEGSMVIARSLFARSLRASETDSAPPFLFADEPELPPLPELSADAQYLLYSILLHDRIDLAHLAESLGDSETNVQSILQSLKESGIVEQSGNLFQLNPFHYLRLRDSLNSNHFLIADE